ncbi:MAG TPA: tetratricopeptide repeat protein [Granulicella sp.]|jgi:tetratricopeptide (TPR) repeat protein|nr:tetratricopeptide repeat protein [Granulicella sp.]
MIMLRHLRALRRCSRLCLFPLLLVQMSPAAALADTAGANAAIQAGRADDAVHLLQTALSSEPRNPKAHQLLCRAYYEQELVDAAVHECETAVAIAPNDSSNQLWMAKAYGQQASRVNLIAAFALARRVRAAFEQAARLDPNNLEAIVDLGHFYVDAPGVVGGGLDKAQALHDRLQALSGANAHTLLAMIADKKGDTATAEAEFQHAIEAANTPEAYIDLGNFYQLHQRYAEAEAALQSAIRQDRAHDQSLVDAASILTAAHRNPQLAEQLLREYLASPAKSEEAPAFRVHVQLGMLLAADGDKPGARREYGAALALASQYAAAKTALEKL